MKTISGSFSRAERLLRSSLCEGRLAAAGGIGLLAGVLASCGNLESHSGPYVNEAAIQQGVNTMERASAYERQGDAPGDAWQRARNDNGFGSPFGMMGSGMVTPIAGYGWSTGTSGAW